MSLLERDRGVFQVVPSEVVPSEVDTLLAKELNQLSFEDREKVYEDLHGVGKIENYGGQRLNDALQQMQVEIDKLEHKPGYDRALSVNSRYIFDRRLRTVFLYAVKLDPFKAALRMERFLQYSSHCFGSQALLRPIRYSDLSPNAVAMMKEGSGLLLPVRDTSGRRVLIVTKDIGEGSSLLDRVSCAENHRLALVNCVKRKNVTEKRLIFVYSNKWTCTCGNRFPWTRRHPRRDLF